MAPLRNVRHERFCVALSEGRSIAESYEVAGFKKNSGNSSRLNADERIRARVLELQTQTAADSKFTIESINRELDEAISVARSKHQAQAMVSASSMKAKLAGLLIERTEVGAPGSFDNLCSIPSIADKVLEQLIERFKPVDERDRDALIAMYQRHIAEAQELIDAINARPITAERVDPRHLDKPWQELPPHSPPARLRGNGASK